MFNTAFAKRFTNRCFLSNEKHVGIVPHFNTATFKLQSIFVIKRCCHPALMHASRRPSTAACKAVGLTIPSGMIMIRSMRSHALRNAVISSLHSQSPRCRMLWKKHASIGYTPISSEATYLNFLASLQDFCRFLLNISYK